MTSNEVKLWLEEHIPHRVRAMLASTEELRLRFPEGQPMWPDATVRRCWTDAVWEGRLSVLRWLSEFVGVSLNQQGVPCRPSKRFPEDTHITDLPQGAYIALPSNDATTLANAWKACTQASVHPTHNSNHPTIDDPERTKAFEIITTHLSTTIYANDPGWVNRWVLRPAR